MSDFLTDDFHLDKKDKYGGCNDLGDDGGNDNMVMIVMMIRGLVHQGQLRKVQFMLLQLICRFQFFFFFFLWSKAS